MTQSPPPFSLADLRREIDRIDETMHRLLMERGEIIETLIEVKKTQASGSAFRPGREADQMKRLAERHQGLLPFDTVESIWRVIVSTFTYVQAPYTVHADTSLGDGLMRDTARFHFGFTVPYITHHGAAGVIDAVARSSGDLGMFRIDGGVTAGPWWTRLADPSAPKIIARLPFVERPDHPAGMPVFVIAKPLAEAAAREILLYCLHLERWRDGLPAALAKVSGEMIGNAADETGLSVLVAIPAKAGLDGVQSALMEAGASASHISEVGSHAARFSFKGHPAS